MGVERGKSSRINIKWKWSFVCEIFRFSIFLSKFKQIRLKFIIMINKSINVFSF